MSCSNRSVYGSDGLMLELGKAGELVPSRGAARDSRRSRLVEKLLLAPQHFWLADAAARGHRDACAVAHHALEQRVRELGFATRRLRSALFLYERALLLREQLGADAEVALESARSSAARGSAGSPSSRSDRRRASRCFTSHTWLRRPEMPSPSRVVGIGELARASRRAWPRADPGRTPPAPRAARSAPRVRAARTRADR